MLRLPNDKVSNGYWNDSKVRFNWNNADNRNSNSGARVEISLKRFFKLENLLCYEAEPSVGHFGYFYQLFFKSNV